MPISESQAWHKLCDIFMKILVFLMKVISNKKINEVKVVNGEVVHEKNFVAHTEPIDEVVSHKEVEKGLDESLRILEEEKKTKNMLAGTRMKVRFQSNVDEYLKDTEKD